MDNNTNNNYSSHNDIERGNKTYLGVSVYHLCTVFQPKVMLYASQILKRDFSEGLTIYDIEDTVGGFLRQMDSSRRENILDEPPCYVETLDGRNKDDVGKATHMLSYCWGNTIDDITTSLVDYCETNRLNVKRTYVWLCFLCQKNEDSSEYYLPPHNIETHFYYQQFEQQIVDIHNVLVLLVPPTTTTTMTPSTSNDNNNNACLKATTERKKAATIMPLYFTRVWCIFELYTSIERNCNITVIMPPREKERFIKSILQQQISTYGSCGGLLQEFILALSSSKNLETKMKIENAETSDPVDKGSILQWINNNTKYDGDDGTCYRRVNTTVTSFMKDWIDTEMVGKTIFRAAQRQLKDPSTDLNLAAVYNGIGLIYKNNNLSNKDTERAMKYLSKSQAIYEKVLTNVYNDIGDVLLKHKPHEAKEYFTKSLVVIAAEENVNDENLIFRTYKNLNLVHSKISNLSSSSATTTTMTAARQSRVSTKSINVVEDTTETDLTVTVAAARQSRVSTKSINVVEDTTETDLTTTVAVVAIQSSSTKSITVVEDTETADLTEVVKDISTQNKKEQQLHEIAEKEERKQTETLHKIKHQKSSNRNVLKSFQNNRYKQKNNHSTFVNNSRKR